MEIQRTIGADIIMAFDECTPYPCDYRYALNENDTPLVRPMCESFESASKIRVRPIFPIVQGSCYKDLRQQSAEYIANKPSRKRH
jgi:queuine tRNA-ribosyltransferase